MTLTAKDLQGMVSHWLGCPPNGYLGSGYGSSVQDLLQAPLGGPEADQLIAKLRADLPVVGALPESAVNVWPERSGPDKLSLYLQIGSAAVPIGAAVEEG
jgi:hypothetical protein